MLLLTPHRGRDRGSGARAYAVLRWDAILDASRKLMLWLVIASMEVIFTAVTIRTGSALQWGSVCTHMHHSSGFAAGSWCMRCGAGSCSLDRIHAHSLSPTAYIAFVSFLILRMHHALGPLSTTAMLIRKPLLLPSTYGSLQAFHTSASNHKSSTSSTRCWTKTSTRPQQQCSPKGYATISGTGTEHAHEKDYDWPLPPKGQRCPTPYQIFALKKNQAYSKARFYQLVKIYHPDKSDASDSGISQEMKSERYRLVVAANIILSDPVKRSAYDRIGAGWDGKADIAGKNGSGAGPFQQNWRDPSDPVWQNATWEDWERWREAREDEAMGVKRESTLR